MTLARRGLLECEKNVSEMRSPNPGRTKKAPNKGTCVGAAQPPWERPVSRLWGDTWGSGVVNLSPAPAVSTLVKRSQPQANSAAPASVNRTSISHAGSVSPWRIAQSEPAVKTNGLLLLLPLHVAAKTLGPRCAVEHIRQRRQFGRRPLLCREYHEGQPAEDDRARCTAGGAECAQPHGPQNPDAPSFRP